MLAGTSIERTRVASKNMATASPKPTCWFATVSPDAKPPNTATMMTAAPVISPAVDRTPYATASELFLVWLYRS